jgi:V-type H+-transporting ATPase subunit a
VQFTDLNATLTPFQRRYVSMIRRCDELQRKLTFFADEVHKCGLPVQTAGSVDEFSGCGSPFRRITDLHLRLQVTR